MGGMLDNLRVLDLSRGAAGAIATMLLADYGAEVVKLEGPDGDPLRAYPMHHIWNRNKASVSCDLATPDGRSVFERLAAGADVFVHCHSPAMAAGLRLAPQDIARRHPHLVQLSISAYGANSPRAEEPEHEALVDAWLGIQSEQMGWRDGPCFNVLQVGTFGAAMLGVQGVLAALRARRMTGEGQHLETSLVDGALVLNTMYWQVATDGTDAAMRQTPRPGLPTRHLAGLGILPCADGRYIQMHSGLHGRFTKALEIFGLADKVEAVPPMEEKTRPLSDNDREFLVREIPRMLLTQPREHWMKLLAEADVSVMEVNAPGEVLRNPGLAQDFVKEIDDPQIGRFLCVGPVISSSVADAPTIRPAPTLGRDPAPAWPPRVQSARSPAKLRTPLEGIRIVDFGAYFAGPYASRLMADLGADVIKIEPPRGDTMRPTAFAFRAANRSKRTIALDLRTEEGQAVAKQLIAEADVVTHSLRPGAAERYGLGYDEVRKINPEVIYLHSTGFGLKSERATEATFAPLLAGLCGLSWQAAGEDNAPLQSISNEDHYNGTLGAVAALMALWHRDETGEGASLETSLFGAILFVTSELMLDPSHNVHFTFALDKAQTGLGPANRLYRCADDRWISLVAASARQWSALRTLVDSKDLPETWSGDLLMRQNPAVAAPLECWFAARNSDTAISTLRGASIPAELSRPSQRQAWFASEENLSSGRVVEYVHPVHGLMRDQGPAIRFSTFETKIFPAPTVGQHSDEILAELGYASDRVAAMRDQGVIR